MNDADKILQAIERLETGQKHLQDAVNEQGNAIGNIRADIQGLKSDSATTKDAVSHLGTAMKALPTKRDVEEIVDTAVDAAKNELKADILNLDAKVSRRWQSHDRRITNLEEHQGIENPEKH